METTKIVVWQQVFYKIIINIYKCHSLNYKR